MPVSSPLVCPLLVDRDEELAALEHLLSTVPHGRLVLIRGEAGAGKSRLVRELLATASAQRFSVLAGGCSERDRSFPFAPIVDALRQRFLGATTAEIRAFLGAEGEAVTELLPELRGLFTVREGLAGLPPEGGKRRLFEALAALLAREAAERPLLLVQEDLHWADPTTLELLELLARRLVHAPVLLLGTARTDEPGMSLEHGLASLRRERLLVEVRLEPLSERGVGSMLESMLPALPPPALVANIFARTGGNPFFVEELLATLPRGAGTVSTIGRSAVPETVRDAVVKRLSGLDERAQRVAEIAAVAGRHATFDLLAATSGMERDELLAAIRALIDTHLLVETEAAGSTRLAFRHALARDAIERRLLASERRELHRLAGETLEGSVGQSTAVDLGELGYHFHRATLWDKALVYATRAGDAARGVHATAEALVHYRRALDAAQALGHPTAGELHRHCGQALGLLGDLEAARRHLERALVLARERQDQHLEQAALYELAGSYASSDYRAAERLACQALDMARVCGNRRRQGLALNRLGNVLTNVARFPEALELHRQALEIFEALGDRWGAADCLDLLAMTGYLAGDAVEARTAFGQAATLFEELGDRERVASALTSRGLYLATLDGPCPANASPRAYLDDARRGLALSREIDWRAGEVYALVAVASAELGDGRFGEAEWHLSAALAIADEIGHRQWTVIALLTVGLLQVDLLDDERALATFERAFAIAREVGSVQWVERLEAWICRCRARLGHRTDARAALTHLVPPTEHATGIAQRRALFTLGELELAEGRPEGALALCDRLDLGSRGARAAHPTTDVLRLRAGALTALGDVDAADATLSEARHRAKATGPRSSLWRLSADLARLWVGRDPVRAEREAAAARAELAALAANVPDEAQRERFLRAPEARPWTVAAGRRRTDDTAGPGGLSPRERGVAASVARGLSNKEIARELSLAEKTVEMHVSSCLGKLGFASRVQLAAWAIAQGIVPPPPADG